MRTRRTALLILTFAVTLPLLCGEPQTDESAIGGGFEWMAIPCETWNCAAAELILANGQPSVLVLPMTAGENKWVVLKRVRAGSFVLPEDAPIKVDCFDSLPLATTRFDGLTQHVPTLVTAYDGKKLVVYTTEAQTAKRRSVK